MGGKQHKYITGLQFIAVFFFPRNLTKEEKKQLKEEEKRMKEQKRLDQQREKERKKREELITKNRQKTMKAFKVKHEMPN